MEGNNVAPEEIKDKGLSVKDWIDIIDRDLVFEEQTFQFFIAKISGSFIVIGVLILFVINYLSNIEIKVFIDLIAALLIINAIIFLSLYNIIMTYYYNREYKERLKKNYTVQKDLKMSIKKTIIFIVALFISSNIEIYLSFQVQNFFHYFLISIILVLILVILRFISYFLEAVSKDYTFYLLDLKHRILSNHVISLEDIKNEYLAIGHVHETEMKKGP